MYSVATETNQYPEHFQNFTVETTVNQLSLFYSQVDISGTGKEIAVIFKNDPKLPGIIIAEHEKLVGLISRRRFLEQLSRPYGLELFMQRPLKLLFDQTKSDVLVISRETKVIDAAKIAVHRPPEILNDPLIVEISQSHYKLLDIHQLLLAQVKIQEITNELVAKLSIHLEKANQIIKEKTLVDDLTNTANRRKFNQVIELEWKRLAVDEQKISLILCSIDNFQAYFDTYGEKNTRSMLQKVAKVLQKIADRPADLVARYEKDEFAIILPNTDNQSALAIAHSIQENIQKLLIPHKTSFVSPHLTISLGVTTEMPRSDVSPQNLIETAQKILECAKNSGRNRYCTEEDLQQFSRIQNSLTELSIIG